MAVPAKNVYQFTVDVENSKALKNLSDFAKAQVKSTQRVEKSILRQVKSNTKLDQAIIKNRAAMAKSRAEYKKATTGKKQNAEAAKIAAVEHEKFSRVLNKQQAILGKSKEKLRAYNRELNKLANAEKRAANRVDPRGRTMYPAPISPQRPGAPMMGPGFAGTRGFSGSSGRRAGITRNIANISQKTSAGFSALGGAAGGGGLLAPLASGFALQQSVSGALDLDSQRQKLKLLSEQYGEYNQILKIIDSSADTFNKSQREATTEFANVFARLRPLGVELHQIKGVYEGFNTVAIASGATSESSRIAFMQLAQAIGSGRLAGDEFRSISEQIPGVLLPISKVMKVNVGDLKALGAEGKITSDVLIHALSHGINISKEEIKEFLAQQPAQKFKAFSNSVSDLGVVVGEALLPALVPLVEKLTELVKGFIALPSPIRNVITVAGVAFLGITALAAAFKTLGLGVGAKFVGNLLASAGGITAAGNASTVAAGKVGVLAAQLKGLAMLGIITVGVNFIMMGMKQGASLEEEVAKLEAGGPGATFEGASRETVVAAQKRAVKTKGEIDQELEDIAPNPLVNAIPGIGPAAAGMAGSRAQQLKVRAANNQTILDLDPNDFKTEADIAAARNLKFQQAIDKANKKKVKGAGKGRDIAGQLAKIESNNRRRLSELEADNQLKRIKNRYEIENRLQQESHRIREANLLGSARAALQIQNAEKEQNAAIDAQLRTLNNAITAAERRLEAAKQQFSEAAPGLDRARSQGTVNSAQARLNSAVGIRDDFAANTEEMRNNAFNISVAQSTEGFRQRAKDAQLEAQALRERNRLMMEGFSPAQVELQMQLSDIERERVDRIGALTVGSAGYAIALQEINSKAALAAESVRNLTTAQEENSNAITDYIANAQNYVGDIKARIVDIASTIEESISSAITGLISGTMSATEAFHNFFKSVGEAFLNMAAQMIAKLIVIKLLKTAIGMFGGGGGDELPTDSFAGVDNKILDSVIGPTPFAQGGIVTGPTNALIGEGGMNEAVVPLPNGRSIPVDMGNGLGAGAVQTNITVNVDQGGQTDTETSGDNANKLGKAIDSAVKRVIMDERRVGGLLYNGRR